MNSSSGSSSSRIFRRRIIAGLVVKNLSKSFGAAKVLRDVSFDVADGEFCVLLGPSGCGKTTLLRLVAGLEEATGGSLFIGDRRVDDLPPRKRDVAFVFQNYALYPHMSVFENLAFPLRVRGAAEEEVRREVLDAARLLEVEDQLERRPQELSGGQRQRVALGRAIVREPKIFLFDEPLSNLDASLRASMRVELARLHRRLRVTILYVTHDQVEAMTLAEKLVVLHQGEIQQIGAPSAIYHEPANIFVAGFVGSPRMNFIEGKMRPESPVFESAGVEIDLSGALSEDWAAHAGKPVTLGIRPEDLRPADSGEASIQGEVDIVEDLGSDRLVHARCGELDLVARVPAAVSPSRGEKVRLGVERGRLHLFYQGRRIQRLPSEKKPVKSDRG